MGSGGSCMGKGSPRPDPGVPPEAGGMGSMVGVVCIGAPPPTDAVLPTTDPPADPYPDRFSACG